jgi:cobalt/nickel transport protein
MSRRVFGLRFLLGALGAAIAVLVFMATGEAHFQMLTPGTNIIGPSDSKSVNLDVVFCHPMEGSTMEMKMPVKFGVLIGGEEKKDLLPTLKKVEVGGHAAYKCEYRVGRPGDYVFFVEPAPYWEPAEEKLIIHYTKTVINVMGDETGWDAELGLPVEIVPLARPYGLWTGNIFRDGKVKAPAAPYITQVVKTDGNGVFAYAMPREGWWGFAALCDGGKMKGPEGTEVEVEAGGLFWVFCKDMK